MATYSQESKIVVTFDAVDDSFNGYEKPDISLEFEDTEVVRRLVQHSGTTKSGSPPSAGEGRGGLEAWTPKDTWSSSPVAASNDFLPTRLKRSSTGRFSSVQPKLLK
jgi:hypothetical protein